MLGGGGHVGLPLSLVFAQAGMRVGIYDTNQATLDRIAAGDMPFLENGADDLLREVLAAGRLEFGADGAMIERANTLVVVIGTPVDEFLGPSTRSPRTSGTALSSSSGAPSTRAPRPT